MKAEEALLAWVRIRSLEKGIPDFLGESLRIEGIDRGPTAEEVAATFRFLRLTKVGFKAICELQAVYAPGQPLRSQEGMNVSVGRYTAPFGGPEIERWLKAVCRKANVSSDPWSIHVEFEALHPFMDGNGRTGRTLWAWHMDKLGLRPFSLPFLHRFYCQTLADRGPAVSAEWR